MNFSRLEEIAYGDAQPTPEEVLDMAQMLLAFAAWFDTQEGVDAFRAAPTNKAFMRWLMTKEAVVMAAQMNKLKGG